VLFILFSLSSAVHDTLVISFTAKQNHVVLRKAKRAKRNFWNLTSALPSLNAIQRETHRSLTTPFRAAQSHSQAERIDGEGKGSDGIGRTKVGRWLLRQFHFSRYSRSSRFLSRFSRPGSFPRTLQFLSSFQIIFYLSSNWNSIVQDDSTLSRQKKDAESNWKSQVFLLFFLFNYFFGFVNWGNIG